MRLLHNSCGRMAGSLLQGAGGIIRDLPCGKNDRTGIIHHTGACANGSGRPGDIGGQRKIASGLTHGSCGICFPACIKNGKLRQQDASIQTHLDLYPCPAPDALHPAMPSGLPTGSEHKYVLF